MYFFLNCLIFILVIYTEKIVYIRICIYGIWFWTSFSLNEQRENMAYVFRRKALKKRICWPKLFHISRQSLIICNNILRKKSIRECLNVCVCICSGMIWIFQDNLLTMKKEHYSSNFTIPDEKHTEYYEYTHAWQLQTCFWHYWEIRWWLESHRVFEKLPFPFAEALFFHIHQNGHISISSEANWN